MPRVHYVKKARKDNPAVKAGESYYHWSFRFGGKRYSATRPKRSQLTQSAFYGTLWDLEDGLEDRVNGVETVEDLQSVVEEVKDEVEALRDEAQESLDNMPEHLQDSSSSGEMLTERIDAMEEWANSLESVDIDEAPDMDDPAADKNDHLQEHLDGLKEEVLSFDPGI